MLKLINLSTSEYYTERYKKDKNVLDEFLQNHNLDGIELLNPIEYNENQIKRENIKGVHLKYFPMWIDFWKNDEDSLLEDFKNKEEAISYYGGNDRDSIINTYRNEIQLAKDLEAEYVVFHVCNVKLVECYSYKFKYSDKEVLDYTIELVNEILSGIDCDIKILFENLWWPGLTFLDKKLAKYFIDNIEYKNKGFMLDTGHLVNTNLNIRNEEEAIEYLIKIIDNLEDVKEHIKGIHLSLSISSEYVKSKICEFNCLPNKEVEFNSDVYYHIYNIDKHRHFTNSKIKRILDIISPEYVVYEFITSSLEELNRFINIQDKAIGL